MCALPLAQVRTHMSGGHVLGSLLRLQTIEPFSMLCTCDQKGLGPQIRLSHIIGHERRTFVRMLVQTLNDILHAMFALW